MIAFVLLLAAAEPAECAHPADQPAWTLCAWKRAGDADEALNRQWRVTLAKVKAREDEYKDYAGAEGTYSQVLVAAQRKWLAWRDAECKLTTYSWLGGTGRSQVQAECLARLTKQRTAVLAELAEGE